MSQLDLFEKRLQEIQDEMGIYLKVAVYKLASTEEYCEAVLYADEERSVHVSPLIKLELNTENELWYKYYKKPNKRRI